MSTPILTRMTPTFRLWTFRRSRPLRWSVVACIAVALHGCQPGPEEQAKTAARLKVEELRRIELCRDNALGSCPDSSPPPIQPVAGVFAVQRWNGQWFKVPYEYHGAGGMNFSWPSKRPAGARLKDDWNIFLYIRSYDIPPEPRGYRRIEVAEREGRVSNRVTLRAGLDRLEYRDVDRVTGKSSSFVFTEYVATERRDPEGQPPVFRCKTNLADPQQAGGGAGFMWRDGLHVEILVRAGNICEDWPELFDEVIRVLDLTEKV